MLSERHEKDAIKKALTDAEEKNEELLMKVEDANEKIGHLQTAINTCVPFLMLCQLFIHNHSEVGGGFFRKLGYVCVEDSGWGWDCSNTKKIVPCLMILQCFIHIHTSYLVCMCVHKPIICYIEL